MILDTLQCLALILDYVTILLLMNRQKQKLKALITKCKIVEYNINKNK